MRKHGKDMERPTSVTAEAHAQATRLRAQGGSH
jgi:hypothetical protein